MDDDIDGWMLRAACRGHPTPDIFFPNPKDTATKQAAARVCRICPVSDTCMDTANSNDERYGIWGGMNRNAAHGGPSRIRAEPQAKRPNNIEAYVLDLMKQADDPAVWLRPRDIGTPTDTISSGLRGLIKKGYVESRQRGNAPTRRSKLYRLKGLS